MTHSPPIPPANQSPYPLQEPPHQEQPALPVAQRSAEDDALISARALGIGAAIGLGSAAAVLAAWFFRRSEARAAPKKPAPAQRSNARKASGAAPAQRSPRRRKTEKKDEGGSSS